MIPFIKYGRMVVFCKETGFFHSNLTDAFEACLFDFGLKIMPRTMQGVMFPDLVATKLLADFSEKYSLEAMHALQVHLDEWTDNEGLMVDPNTTIDVSVEARAFETAMSDEPSEEESPNYNAPGFEDDEQ